MFQCPLPPRGRLLGIDYGSVRIGLAICDYDRIIASPFETYTRQNPESDALYFQKLIKAEQIVGMVIGLPLSLNDTEGPKAKETRVYAEWLASLTSLPYEFVDERFTTSAAEDTLIAAGVKRDKRKGQRDRIAAVFILQSFLDS